MAKTPDRINIDKEDRTLYKKLDQEEILRSKGGERTRKDQFLFALAIGFINEVKHPLKTKDGFFLTKDLHPADEALLNAIAIYDIGSADVLSNRVEIFRIAEEYAHAGIIILCNKIESKPFGSFEKHIEKDIIEIYKKLNLNK